MDDNHRLSESSSHDLTPEAEELKEMFTELASIVEDKLRNYFAVGGSRKELIKSTFEGCDGDPNKLAVIRCLAKSFMKDAEGEVEEKSENLSMVSLIQENEKQDTIDFSSDDTANERPVLPFDELVTCFARLFAGKIDENMFDGFITRVRLLISTDERFLLMVARVLSDFEYASVSGSRREVFQRVASTFNEESHDHSTQLNNNTSDQFVLRVAIVRHYVAKELEVHLPMLDALTNILLPVNDSIISSGSSINLYGCCTYINTLLAGLFDDILSSESVSTADAPIVLPKDIVLLRSVFAASICDPEVHDQMLKSLFTAKLRSYLPDGETVHEVRRNALCNLVSCSMTMIDLSQEEILEKMSDSMKLLDLQRNCEEAHENILAAVKICEELKVGSMRHQFNGTKMKKIYEGIAEPSVASGMLHWAEEGLQKGDNESSEQAVLFTGPLHLRVVELVAARFSAIREQALEILLDGFERPNHEMTSLATSNRLKDMFFSSMIKFVHLQVGLELTKKFICYADDETIDEGYLRLYVKSFFELVSQPFDDEVHQAISDLLRKDRVRSACKKDKTVKRITQKYMKKANSKARNN